MPYELIIDKIAQRYGVLPEEVLEMDSEWLLIIIGIMEAEVIAEDLEKRRNDNKLI